MTMKDFGQVHIISSSVISSIEGYAIQIVLETPSAPERVTNHGKPRGIAGQVDKNKSLTPLTAVSYCLYPMGLFWALHTIYFSKQCQVVPRHKLPSGREDTR
jgi:hypothetical protein